VLKKEGGREKSSMRGRALTFTRSQYYKFGKQASAKGTTDKHALYVMSQYNSHPRMNNVPSENETRQQYKNASIVNESFHTTEQLE
jgi:hypothetical protein